MYIENAYLRKRLETLKMDVDRAEMRMAKSEQARIEADQRYNEMVDKYRQLQNSIIDGNVLSP